MPSSQTCWSVKAPVPLVCVPQIHRYAPSEVIETRLFRIGAHIIGPNFSRAFST